MKAYLTLMWTLANRQIRSARFHPLVAFSLGLGAFILLSNYLFEETEYGSYLFLISCAYFQLKLSEPRRNEFLKITFGDSLKRKIRLLENSLIAFPFIVFLIYKDHYLLAFTLIASSVILAFIYRRFSLNISIPSPFSKNSLEFTRGFRKTFALFLFAYIIAAIGIGVDNQNLGIFALLLCIVICLSFYTKPEPDYYVWIHAQSSREFLNGKLKIASLNATLISSPILITLLIFYPEDYESIFTFLILGIAFLITVVLAKYGAYPKKMNLSESVLIGLALYFPPIILGLIPYFYYQSIGNLKALLND